MTKKNSLGRGLGALIETEPEKAETSETFKSINEILISEIELPIIVDAGIGRPSEAVEAMEMGAAAVLVNTAIATAADPALMAEAFGQAVEVGRKAYLAGPGATRHFAEASSPLTGFLRHE